MHRIDTKTAQKDKFGAGKNGFTRGNPQTGTPATDLDDNYFDMLQEELCSVVEASGASLEKGRHDQLLTALRALLLSRKNPFGDIKSDGTVQTALENLGMTDILNDKQDKNDNLTSFSSLTGIPDGLAFFTGAGTMDMTALTQNGREILSKKNVSETLKYLTLGDGTGRLLGVQVFGSSGTYHKSPGVTKIIVEAVGGGGASGNLSATASNNCGISAAGSPGAYGKAFYYQDIPESVPVTIGAGGVGGAGPGGSGGDGGQTSFGSLLVCPGGKGSQQRQQVPPFSGGSAAEASPPTGAGLLFHSVSRSPSCAAFGLGDDMAVGLESTVSTMIGVYGKGGTGKYGPANSAASRGNDGSQGYIIVWEYQ
ncbi:hypothetical protein K6625_14960 [Escherichia coli]|nr:hypothetical protein [Escherichia coli]MBZ2263479.1 hypothetical protein [Escherichia coli]MBZ2310138.1 hypothetical protein [Escherichia coli]MBZ2355838.1 hypothetical protein [Escherichia coli]MBZ2369664.1 hypothetical protein [Escherichia coli]